MHDIAVNALFIEDMEEDVELAVRALEKDGVSTAWSRVASEAELKQALAEARPEVILSDFSMPGFDGLQALRIARVLAPGVPFIFLSGTIGEERAIEAIRSGATDYVLKNNPRRLGTAVRRALDEVAERRAYEERIRYLANYDALLGLPNRSLLGDRTVQAITHSRRSGRSCALLVADLDRFKRVNESYGHQVGDALLAQFAERLRRAVREGDTVARLSEAFAVLAADLARPDDVHNVARKIRDAVETPFTVNGQEIHLTVSLGASIYPKDGEQFEDLVRNAEAAMHRVKAGGGNGLQFYAAEMTREAIERLETEGALRAAIARKELQLHYQPLVEVSSGRIVGVEALMRWQHQSRGWISPGLFIPLAEESDLIQPLGTWALTEACRRLALWKQAAYPRLRMAVNVSARQFRDPGFVETVGRALRGNGVEPSLLDLELTESVLVEDRARVASVLQELKGLGVRVAIDDFGTGYSSLSYLSTLPIDSLKIDRSFVSRAAQGGRDASISQAVISLGHALGLRVLAEGVETREQLQFLRSHGCDEAQGFLFARPAAAEAIAPLLRSGKSDA
jgi:diguanylate cyclase (GGDEF)-like protein